MPTLVTWTDRGGAPAPDHHGPRPAADRGPVLRLLDHRRYERVIVLVPPASLRAAREWSREAREVADRVELQPVEVTDPSDYAQVFAALGGVAAGLRGTPDLEVLLSAGTPQVQTLWVILVQSGLLGARMLQVIPARFVPVPHPEPVREVQLPLDGFPEIRALREEVVRLRADGEVREMVGESAALRGLRARMLRVAPTDVPVLVRGETGTGKELVARALHQASHRRRGPFVACNGGSLDDGLLASELFGHEAGAFTGAVGARRGLFELAHGGTLFLDEVGELSARVQVGLLRALQEGEIRRLGGEGPVRVDVRVVTATHRDLPSRVAAGAFREDLWFRLSGVVLEVPPLRERPEDLPALVARFLAEQGRPELTVSPAAWARISAWRWPGNVRELRAEVVRWCVFADHRVDVDDLSPELRGHAPTGPTGELGAGSTLAEVVAAAERDAVARAWTATERNVSAAARALGVDRNTLKRKLRSFGLR